MGADKNPKGIESNSRCGPVNLSLHDYVVSQSMLLMFYMVITPVVTFVIIVREGYRQGNFTSHSDLKKQFEQDTGRV